MSDGSFAKQEPVRIDIALVGVGRICLADLPLGVTGELALEAPERNTVGAVVRYRVGDGDLAIEPEELSRILELESKKNAAVPHLPAADVAALMATVAERSDVEAALRLWKRYGKSSGSGPWLEWLRDHLGRLGS